MAKKKNANDSLKKWLEVVDIVERPEKHLVKRLKEETGYGMLDCKKALQESGNDMAKAKSWLEEKMETQNLTALVTKRPNHEAMRNEGGE